ncbi:MAG: ribosome recycling factor, partial [Ignavibacteriales bacterium]|nr:ribosome recycling factor [Ignavibacteriales bacterium]
MRNVRRDANDHLKKQEKDKKMTEDELKEAEKETQKLTDEHIVKIDDIIKHK